MPSDATEAPDNPPLAGTQKSCAGSAVGAASIGTTNRTTKRNRVNEVISSVVHGINVCRDRPRTEYVANGVRAIRSFSHTLQPHASAIAGSGVHAMRTLKRVATEIALSPN